MNAEEFVNTVLIPGASWCAEIPGWRAAFIQPANIMLVAISGQEAHWTARVQNNNGPAHGLFQFERRGGVAGVLKDDATAALARAACDKAGVAPDSLSVWKALVSDDALAVAFARLLLWSDEAPLCAVGDEEGSWRYYLRNWGPGKPDHARWHINYQSALRWAPSSTLGALSAMQRDVGAISGRFIASGGNSPNQEAPPWRPRGDAAIPRNPASSLVIPPSGLNPVG